MLPVVVVVRMLEPLNGWLGRAESVALQAELLVQTDLGVARYFGPLELD